MDSNVNQLNKFQQCKGNYDLDAGNGAGVKWSG